MIVDGAGELIADVMTINRGLLAIPSASAILDASNYTFQAISYGKDSDGFRNHAHRIINASGDGIIKVLQHEDKSVSAYRTFATASALESVYNLLPTSPSPLDKRLELKSTVTLYSSGVPDIGHCLNSIINPNLSANSQLIGCFPASGGTKYWFISSIDNPSGSMLFSGSLSSFYNYYGLMDSSGFLTFGLGNLSTHNQLFDTSNYTKGVIRNCQTSSFPQQVNLTWKLNSGDAGSLLLFGGIYHLGLWTLDLKEMLKRGYYPPYSFNTLNNTRIYKLFAKKTFSQDLLYLNDSGGEPAFKTYFDMTSGKKSDMILTWNIKFL